MIQNFFHFLSSFLKFSNNKKQAISNLLQSQLDSFHLSKRFSTRYQITKQAILGSLGCFIHLFDILSSFRYTDDRKEQLRKQLPYTEPFKTVASLIT